MGIRVSGYISESGMTNCGSGSLELLCLWPQLWTWNDRLWLGLAWSVVEACTWPPFSPLSGTRWDDGENSTASLLNIHEHVLTCDLNIFLATNAHCQEAIHPIWIFVLAGGLCLKHGCADHNAYMDEDQNNDLSYGQLDHSVGILQSVVEAEQDLEQLQVNCHTGIRHSEIWWAWCSPEYERTHPCHIQDQCGACCGQALPKVWWWAWEVQAEMLHLYVYLL